MWASTTLALLVVMVGCCGGQELDCSYVPLLRHLNLLQANDTLVNVRPVYNWRTVTNVTVDLFVFGILEVNEKMQTLSCLVSTEMTWKSEFIAWNSSDFCGIEEMSVPREQLWVPPVVIYEDTSDADAKKPNPFVQVRSNGVIWATVLQHITVICKLNLLMFPFDMQSCNVTISARNGAYKVIPEIALGTLLDVSLLTSYSSRFMVTLGEWQLVRISLTKQHFQNMVFDDTLIYTITLSRKPLLYVINLIVPLLCFLILDLATIFISEAREEMLSFKVTLLLSISVLLLILNDMLPSTEERLPLMALYCLAIFMMVGVSLFETMLVRFLLDIDCKCGPCKDPGKGVELVEKLNGDSQVNSNLVLLTCILEEVRRARQECLPSTDQSVNNHRCFKNIVKKADIAFWVVYMMSALGFTVFMYIFWVRPYINILYS